MFGDLIPTTCPKTIDELIAILPTLTNSLQKTNNGKGRPLEYVMLPISELAEVLNLEIVSPRIFRSVEECVTHEIETMFDEIERLRMIIHTMHMSMRRSEEFFLENELDQIESDRSKIARFEREVRTKLGEMLLQVRSNQKPRSELDRLMIDLEKEMADYRTKIKETERSELSQKVRFANELKESGVISVREPTSLEIVQHRHPKDKLIVLYSSEELRSKSREQWIISYFDFLHQIESNNENPTRLLFCYFDFDLNPHYQPQNKSVQVREYISLTIEQNSVDHRSLVRWDEIFSRTKFIDFLSSTF